MKFYNKHEADRYGLAEEAIGDMIAKCSRMLYYESLTDEERKIIEKKKWEFHEEQTALNINNQQQVEAVIKKYCPLLKNGLVTLDYLLYGKTSTRKSA